MAKQKAPARPKTRELRVQFSPVAYERILAQSIKIDQTIASFTRQIIMEKIVQLEAIDTQNEGIAFLMSEIEKLEIKPK